MKKRTVYLYCLLRHFIIVSLHRFQFVRERRDVCFKSDQLFCQTSIQRSLRQNLLVKTVEMKEKVKTDVKFYATALDI